MTARETGIAPRPVEPKEVGKRIALARERAGLKQADLAETLGVIPRSMQNYEYGRIPYRLLDRIADATSVSKDWILYGDNVDGDTAAVAVPTFDARLDEIEAKLDTIIGLLKRRR